MGPALLDATDNDNRTTLAESAVLKVSRLNKEYAPVAELVDAQR